MGLCAANFILALAIPAGKFGSQHSEHVPSRPRLAQWMHAFESSESRPALGRLLSRQFCFTCFETTIGLLVGRFSLGRQQRSGLEIIGFLSLSAHHRRCRSREAPSAKWSNAAVSRVHCEQPLHGRNQHGPDAFIHGSGAGAWTLLLLTLSVLSIVSSLTRPPVFGLISILTPAHEQGATIGWWQAPAACPHCQTHFRRNTARTSSCPTLFDLSGISLLAAFLGSPTLLWRKPRLQPSRQIQKSQLNSKHPHASRVTPVVSNCATSNSFV